MDPASKTTAQTEIPDADYIRGLEFNSRTLYTVDVNDDGSTALYYTGA